MEIPEDNDPKVIAHKVATKTSSQHLNDAYKKLIFRRMNQPRVVIDNESCENATVIQVYDKTGILREVVRVLSNLDLIIAEVSRDDRIGSWFMNVINVTDQNGNKITDEKILDDIRKSLEQEYSCSINSSVRRYVEVKPSMDHTAIELKGDDRPGLLSEVISVLKDLKCNAIQVEVRTHNTSVEAKMRVTDEETSGPITDPERLSMIKKLLSNVLEGNSKHSVICADSFPNLCPNFEPLRLELMPNNAMSNSGWEALKRSMINVHDCSSAIIPFHSNQPLRGCWGFNKTYPNPMTLLHRSVNGKDALMSLPKRMQGYLQFGPRHSNYYIHRGNELKSIFNAFDTNGDGRLSDFELTQVLAAMGFDKSLDVVQMAMSELNYDHDGFIDFEEFTNLYRKILNFEKTDPDYYSNNNNRDYYEALINAHGTDQMASNSMRQSPPREILIDIHTISKVNQSSSDQNYWATVGGLFVATSAATGLATSLPFSKVASGMGFLTSCAAVFSIGWLGASTTRVLTVLGAVACASGTLAALGQEFMG